MFGYIISMDGGDAHRRSLAILIEEHVIVCDLGITNDQEQGRGGVLICYLPYLVIWPLTTHPFLVGAPFLHQIAY